MLAHFDSIGRGVIDLRDAIYFLSLAAIFLTLAYGALMGRKLAHGHAPLRRLRLGVLLIVGLLVVVNLAGSYIGGRIDLTPGKAYTLAPATRQLVRSLDDIVEAHAEGTVARVRPKLMTVATMLIGLVPLLWATGSGADVMKRIAAPMVGGLVTSFALELLVYPALFALWKVRALPQSHPS